MALLSVGWPGRGEVGGAARYGYRLASELARLVDLTVITTSGGVHVRGANMIYVRDWHSRLGHYYGFPVHARRIIRDLRPDIVHAFGDDWALRKSGPALVRTFHGSSLSEAKNSRGLRKINHYVLALLEWHAQRRSDVRIAVGPESMQRFSADYLMPPIAAPIITMDRTPTDTPSVVFLGGWDGRKRGSLVEATVDEARSTLGREVTLTVFGNQRDRSNWSTSTNFVVDADDAGVQETIRDSWVLLAPSLYEGFGIPMFEALMFGVPVIASRNPGSIYLQKALGAGASALRIVSDEDLAAALADRISAGPNNELRVASHAASVTAEMLRTASARYLVENVYTPLARKGQSDG